MDGEEYLVINISPDITIYEIDEKKGKTEYLLSVPIELLKEYPDQLLDSYTTLGEPITKHISSLCPDYRELKELSMQMNKLYYLCMQETEEFQSKGCINGESVYQELNFFPQLQQKFFKCLLNILNKNI